jgi:hypothetical protein
MPPPERLCAAYLQVEDLLQTFSTFLKIVVDEKGG